MKNSTRKKKTYFLFLWDLRHGSFTNVVLLWYVTLIGVYINDERLDCLASYISLPTCVHFKIYKINVYKSRIHMTDDTTINGIKACVKLKIISLSQITHENYTYKCIFPAGFFFFFKFYNIKANTYNYICV